MASIERYDFDFEERFVRPLKAMRVRPDTSYITIAPSGMRVRFGPWRIGIPLDDVAGAEVHGPFKAWRVIGPRWSMSDRGLTFGSSTGRGVCIRFREPLGLMRHPGMTVTVSDPEALARRLNEIAETYSRR